MAFSPEWILALASIHAEDNDDGLLCEIFDLRDYLRAAYRQLPAARRVEFLEHPAVSEVLVGAGCEMDGIDMHTKLRGKAGVNFLIKQAKQHGEDDPDHEVGDLQDYFRPLWGMLDIDQQRAFLADPEVYDLADVAGVELASTDEGVDQDEWERVAEEFGADTSFLYSDEQIIDYVNAARLQDAHDAHGELHTVELRARVSRNSLASAGRGNTPSGG